MMKRIVFGALVFAKIAFCGVEVGRSPQYANVGEYVERGLKEAPRVAKPAYSTPTEQASTTQEKTELFSAFYKYISLEDQRQINRQQLEPFLVMLGNEGAKHEFLRDYDLHHANAEKMRDISIASLKIIRTPEQKKYMYQVTSSSLNDLFKFFATSSIKESVENIPDALVPSPEECLIQSQNAGIKVLELYYKVIQMSNEDQGRAQALANELIDLGIEKFGEKYAGTPLAGDIADIARNNINTLLAMLRLAFKDFPAHIRSLEQSE
jgi:hypothetical protein